jgi:hypothetical protein
MESEEKRVNVVLAGLVILLGITSFTPLSTRFPHFLLDICEGINYLRNIRGNQPHGE